MFSLKSVFVIIIRIISISISIWVRGWGPPLTFRSWRRACCIQAPCKSQVFFRDCVFFWAPISDFWRIFGKAYHVLNCVQNAEETRGQKDLLHVGWWGSPMDTKRTRPCNRQRTILQIPKMLGVSMIATQKCDLRFQWIPRRVSWLRSNTQSVKFARSSSVH